VWAFIASSCGFQVSSFEDEATTPGLPLEFDPTDYGGRSDSDDEDLIAATMGAVDAETRAGTAAPATRVPGATTAPNAHRRKKPSDPGAHGATWERGGGPALALWLESNGLDSRLAPPLAQLCAQHSPTPGTPGPGSSSSSRSGGRASSGWPAGCGEGSGGGGSAAGRVASLPLGPSLTCLLRHCSLREIVLVAEALNRTTATANEAPPKPWPLEPLKSHSAAPPPQGLVRSPPALHVKKLMHEGPTFAPTTRAAQPPATAPAARVPGGTAAARAATPCSSDEEAPPPPWAEWASAGWGFLTGAASRAAEVAREEVADFGAPTPGHRGDRPSPRQGKLNEPREGATRQQRAHSSDVYSSSGPSVVSAVVSQPRANPSPSKHYSRASDSPSLSSGSNIDNPDPEAPGNASSPAANSGLEGDWRHQVDSLMD
jgi:hypothetical protein